HQLSSPHQHQHSRTQRGAVPRSTSRGRIRALFRRSLPAALRLDRKSRPLHGPDRRGNAGPDRLPCEPARRRSSVGADSGGAGITHMDWQKGRQSDNVVEDQGGGYGGGGGGYRFGGFHLGIGGTILVVIIALIFPQTRPLIMSLFLNGGVDTSQPVNAPAPPSNAANLNDPQHQFVRSILGSTEDVWGAYFQAGGRQYERPKLDLFHGRTRSGCGAAEESMGPFYCPADHRVYLDLDFFHEMDTRFHATGDF